LQLRQADFTPAARISEAVNRHFGLTPAIAHAESSGVVAVDTPTPFSGRPVEFIAELENVTVEADRPAKIVINERTGTIVMGKEVRIAPVSILHGGLTVDIETTFNVSQPEPLAQGGSATVTPEVKVSAKDDKARSISLKQGASVEELVRALLSIGSTARDVIAILQNLRASGALEAEVEVI
jgi:flagellar P-ring protein precursor FlgI